MENVLNKVVEAPDDINTSSAPHVNDRNVYFVSLGCSKNLVDSQVMLGLLRNDQYRVTKEPDQADVIVVNTCSFIESAKVESVDTILEMASYKDQGKCKALVV